MSIGGTAAYRDRTDLPGGVIGEPARHAAADRLFAGDPRATVLHGDRTDLAAYGPFDLLVLDGGGKTVEPVEWLAVSA